MLSPRDSAANTTSLLTPEIRSFILQEQDWPSGLEIRLLDRITFIRLVLFRDNMVRFDGEDLEQISRVCNRVFEKLRNDGVPIWLKVYRDKEEEERLRD